MNFPKLFAGVFLGVAVGILVAVIYLVATGTPSAELKGVVFMVCSVAGGYGGIASQL